MTTAIIGDNARAQLQSVIERIENREEAKAEIATEIKEIYLEAKSNGYDGPALREIIRRRKADAEKLAAHEAIVDVYMSALNMLVRS